MLYLTPEKPKPIEAETFLAGICNFLAAPRRLPKQMVLSNVVAQPPFIISIYGNKDNHETVSNGADSVVADVHYKPTETEQTRRFDTEKFVHRNQSTQTPIEK